MTIVDRIVLGLMWVSWCWSRMHWAIAMAALDRADFHPLLVQRRLKKLEHVAWRNCTSKAARLHREQRRVSQ